MLVKLIGDIHGDHEMRESLTVDSIQIGDFDLYGYDWWKFNDGNRYFIDGNHDNFDCLNPSAEKPYDINTGLVYIPRGFVSGKVLFMGGADSIDKMWRLDIEEKQRRRRNKKIGFGSQSALKPPLVHWHFKETITLDEYEKTLDTGEIEVVISHECPDFVGHEIVGHQIKLNESSIYLAKIFAKKLPKLWIFGHHHKSFDRVIHDCRFVCLDINEVREFDIPLDPNFFKEK